MATVPYLLFLAVPIIAVLALDTETFVLFFVLFCAAAALWTSSAGQSTDLFGEDVDKDERLNAQTGRVSPSGRRCPRS